MGRYLMRTPKLGMLVCAICIFLSTGCDPVRKTSQIVHLQVSNSGSGEVVAGAEVQLKYDFERAEPLPPETGREPEWYDREASHQFKSEQWAESPWSIGTTDNNGRADVNLEYVRIDHTPRIIFKPPSWRDESEKPYLIKVAKEQIQEEFSLVMQPGASVQGESFTVSIIDIEEPRYVKLSSEE